MNNIKLHLLKKDYSVQYFLCAFPTTSYLTDNTLEKIQAKKNPL